MIVVSVIWIIIIRIIIVGIRMITALIAVGVRILIPVGCIVTVGVSVLSGHIGILVIFIRLLWSRVWRTVSVRRHALIGSTVAAIGLRALIRSAVVVSVWLPILISGAVVVLIWLPILISGAAVVLVRLFILKKGAGVVFIRRLVLLRRSVFIFNGLYVVCGYSS